MRVVLTWLRRICVTAAVALALFGPVAGFLGHPLVPAPLRVAWLIVAAAAAIAPVPSFLAFLAGGFLLPVVPSMAGWPNASLIEQWALALLVPAALRAVWGRGGPVPVPSPWAGVLALMVTASVLVAVAPLTVAHGGLRGLAAEVFDFLRHEYVTGSSQNNILASVASWAVVIEGLAIFWLARGVVAQVGRAPVLRTLAGAAIVIASCGIWQWWSGEYLLAFWRQYDPYLRRVNSTFTDVNALGAFLAMLLPAAIWLAGQATTWWRRVAWLAGGLALVVANVFTASRVAWVGMLIGVAMLGWIVVRHGVTPISEQGRVWLRRVAGGACVAGLALLVTLAAWGTARDVRVTAQQSYLDPVLATLNMRAPLAERLKGRLAFWDAAWAMLVERPLDGVGIGRFYKDVSRYSSDPARLPRQKENAHNYFLQLAAEVGVPAALALLAIWAGALARAREDTGDEGLAGDERWAAAAGAAGLVAFAVTCLSGHSLLLHEGQVATWVVAAVALGPLRGDRGHAGFRATAWAAALAMILVTASVVPRSRAAVDAVDRTHVFEGLHEEEDWPDGRRFRWTERDAVFHVPASAVSVTFTLRALAPVTQWVDISIDGRDVDRLIFDHHNWRVMRYVLPNRRAAGYLSVRLRVTPTWNAPGDERELGVMLSDITWNVP